MAEMMRSKSIAYIGPLLGDKDKVVAALQNAPAVTQALAGNARATVVRMPGLNHFFQTAGSGEFDEVAAIEETIAPEVLKLIADWSAQWTLTS